MNIEEEFLDSVIDEKLRSSRKKTKNTKAKGNRGERDCKDILSERNDDF